MRLLFFILLTAVCAVDASAYTAASDSVYIQTIRRDDPGCDCDSELRIRGRQVEYIQVNYDGTSVQRKGTLSRRHYRRLLDAANTDALGTPPPVRHLGSQAEAVIVESSDARYVIGFAVGTPTAEVAQEAGASEQVTPLVRQLRLIQAGYRE